MAKIGANALAEKTKGGLEELRSANDPRNSLNGEKEKGTSLEALQGKGQEAQQQGPEMERTQGREM